MRVSISQIKCFKSCRRAYELKYIEGLEPVQKSYALETGTNYHQKLEDLYNTGTFDCDYSKESAMATAYKKYIYPHFKVQSVEDWIEYKINDQDTYIGRVDGIASDNHLVEHKTTSSSDIIGEYEYNLLWDEQILGYMLATNTRKIWYTVCRKPTIRQKKDESDEEFFNRMVEWYDEDTESKIRYFEVTRTDEEVEQFRQDLIKIVEEMKNPYCYKNTQHCNSWGRRCEYSSVCIYYDPNQDYVEFTKSERRDSNGN